MARHPVCSVKRAGAAPNKLSRTNRANAVGPDNEVGFDLRSVGEVRHRMIFKGRHAGATRLERDDGIRHGVAQQAMQVGAMRREVGSVELLARKPFQRLAIAQACRIPGDRHNCRRLECETLQGILEPEGAQYFDPIWTDLEASADFTEIGRALVDRNLNPKLAQRACAAMPPIPAPITATRGFLCMRMDPGSRLWVFPTLSRAL
jgi:hypothetical protein